VPHGYSMNVREKTLRAGIKQAVRILS